jgi:hypothetical protein
MLTWDGDATVPTENLPNRAGGAWETKTLGEEIGIACEVIQDGPGTGCSLEVRGRVVTNLQDALNDELVERHGRMLAMAWQTQKDSIIVRQCSAETLSPLLDPSS